MSATMRAAVLERFGEPLVLKDIPKPVAGPGEVLVRIAASGVNPLDVKIHDGVAGHAKVNPTAILGMDLAGTIEAVGADVDGFRIGDDVFGMTGGVGTLPGSLAEYAAVDARLIALKPNQLSMREAAALPLTFITAWEGLVDRAAVNAKHTVLIHGGAGGVGSVCVQIAHDIGATVFATGDKRNHELIASYGATPIDYKGTTVEEYVASATGGAGFDIVYDTVGGSVLDASFTAVRLYTGHVVSCLGWGTHSLAPLSFRGATYSGVFTLLPMLTGNGREHHGNIMREAAALAGRNGLAPRVDPRTFSLAMANDAHDVMREASANGKIVVTIAET